MSVSKRKTSKGVTKHFHYRFYHNGKIHSGICENCATKEDALKFEKVEREKAISSTAAIRGKKQTRKKAEKIVTAILGTDSTTGISLKDAFTESLEKPKKRKATGDFLHAKESYWNDFVTFINDTVPGVQSLKDVERKHAESYISHIRDHGRYQKKIEWTSKGKKRKAYTRKGNYSHKTCNVIHDTLKEVFKLLMDDTGLSENPFSGIEKLDNQSATREPFTEEQLKVIFEKADPFTYPIFAIGVCTALREGDICTLQWDEVNFKGHFIRRMTSKTSKIVEIPMMPPLEKYLSELKAKAEEAEAFVLPEHNKMYDKNAVGISRRVKKFLKGLDIQTKMKIKGRTRLVSIRDVHSLRHSFAYLAGLYGIPLMIVQSICGHMTPAMTSLYQRHADLKAKQTALARMPAFLSLAAGETDADKKTIDDMREELKLLLSSASEEQLRAIYGKAKEACGRKYAT